MKRSNIGRLTTGLLGSAALGFGVMSGSRFRRDIRHARECLERLESQLIQTEYGQVEYAVRGEGEPVLVVHGNGGGFDQGLGLAHTYIGQGFKIISPSRFGYLRSPVLEGATPAMQADVYARLLDVLGIDRVAIFTSSAGVTSSIQFSLRYPERATALILHSPNAPGQVGLVPPPLPVFNALVHSDYGFWAMSTYFGSVMQAIVGVPKGFTLTPEYQAEIKAVLTGSLPASQRGDGIIFDTYSGNQAINHYPLGDVQTPTLVISAVDDPMALHSGACDLAEQIPSARLVAVPDGGHLMLGRTREVKTEVIRFLLEATAKAGNIRE